MNKCIHLSDGSQTIIDGSSGEQIANMIKLMDGGDAFTLVPSSQGSLFVTNGCVGQIEFFDGGKICIVPEVSVSGTEVNPQKLLIDMMNTIFAIDSGKTQSEDLFEFFVMLFVDSVHDLIVRGMRSKYVLVAGNETAFRGKIIFSENIRQNYIHRERVYVEYEVYSKDRPENRVIKRTLEAVLRKTKDSHNIKAIKTVLQSFEEVTSSQDVARDFGMCSIDRNMVDYVSPLMWCDIFMNGMGMGNGSKSAMSYAILLDSHDVFAAYVARKSSLGRTDGSYNISYEADIKTDNSGGGTSVVRVKLNWCFFDRVKGLNLTDAEALFKNAPGYRVIPGLENGDRLRLMASSYLSDMLGRC